MKRTGPINTDGPSAKKRKLVVAHHEPTRASEQVASGDSAAPDWSDLIDLCQQTASADECVQRISQRAIDADNCLDDRDLNSLAALMILKRRRLPNVPSDLLLTLTGIVRRCLVKQPLSPEPSNMTPARSRLFERLIAHLIPGLPELSDLETKAVFVAVFPIVMLKASDAQVVQFISAIGLSAQNKIGPTLFEEMFLTSEFQLYSPNKLRSSLLHFLNIKADRLCAKSNPREREARAPRSVRDYYSKLPDWPEHCDRDDWLSTRESRFYKKWLKVSSDFCYLMISALAHNQSTPEHRRKQLAKFLENVAATASVYPMSIEFLVQASEAVCHAARDSEHNVSRLCVEIIPTLYGLLRNYINHSSTNASAGDNCFLCGCTMTEESQTESCMQCGIHKAHRACIGENWICELCEEAMAGRELGLTILDKWSSCFYDDVVMNALRRRDPTLEDSQADSNPYRPINVDPLWYRLMIFERRLEPLTDLELSLYVGFIGRACNSAPKADAVDSESDRSRHESVTSPTRTPSRPTRSAASSPRKRKALRRSVDLLPKQEVKIESPWEPAVVTRVPVDTADAELLNLTRLYIHKKLNPRTQTHVIDKAGQQSISRLLARFLDALGLKDKLTGSLKDLIRNLVQESGSSSSAENRNLRFKALSCIPLHLKRFDTDFKSYYMRLLTSPSKSVDAKKSAVQRLTAMLDVEDPSTSASRVTSSLLGRCVAFVDEDNEPNSEIDMVNLSAWILHMLTNSKQLEIDLRRWTTYKLEIFKLLSRIGAPPSPSRVVEQVHKTLLRLVHLDFMNSASTKFLIEYARETFFSLDSINQYKLPHNSDDQADELDANPVELQSCDQGCSEPIVRPSVIQPPPAVWSLLSFCLFADFNQIKVIDETTGSPVKILSLMSIAENLPALIRAMTESLMLGEVSLETGILKTLSLLITSRAYATVRTALPWMLEKLSETPKDQATAARACAIMELLSAIPKASWLISVPSIKDLQLALLNLARVHGKAAEDAISLLLNISSDPAPVIAAILNADLSRFLMALDQTHSSPPASLAHSCHKFETVFQHLTMEQLDSCKSTLCIISCTSGTEFITKLFHLFVQLSKNYPTHTPAVISTIGSLTICYPELNNDPEWSSLLIRIFESANQENVCATQNALVVSEILTAIEVSIKLLHRRSTRKKPATGRSGANSTGQSVGGKLQLLALPTVVEIICYRQLLSVPTTESPVLRRKCHEYIQEVFEQGIVPTGALFEPILAGMLSDDAVLRQQSYHLSQSLVKQATDAQGAMRRKVWAFALTSLNIAIQQTLRAPDGDRSDSFSLDDYDYTYGLDALHLFYKEHLAPKITSRNAFLGTLIRSMIKVLGSLSEMTECLERILFPPRLLVNSDLILSDYIHVAAPSHDAPCIAQDSQNISEQLKHVLAQVMLYVLHLGNLIATWPYEGPADLSFAIETLTDVSKLLQNQSYSTSEVGQNTVLLCARTWGAMVIHLASQTLGKPASARSKYSSDSELTALIPEIALMIFGDQIDLEEMAEDFEKATRILTRKLSIWLSTLET